MFGVISSKYNYRHCFKTVILPPTLFSEINRETSTALNEGYRQLNSALKLTLVGKYELFSSKYERYILNGKNKTFGKNRTLKLLHKIIGTELYRFCCFESVLVITLILLLLTLWSFAALQYFFKRIK